MRWGLIVLMGLLAACTNEGAVRYGPQQWNQTQFVVETRPSPLQAGMNEFIVIATRNDARPGVKFVVSLRIGESGEWHQAIQDGYTGVYRRAVRVTDPETDVLSVKVKESRGDAQTTLYFPLGKAPLSKKE